MISNSWRYYLTTFLLLAVASADSSAVASARETYISYVDNLFLRYDGLEPKLAQVESSSQSADKKLFDVYNTLESHLKDAKIASTVGSAASIIGAILLFTPAAPLGLALAAGGTATSFGTCIAQNFFFDRDASEEFEKVVDAYTSSSDALQKLFLDIEATKAKLSQSLEEFLAQLHAHSLPDLGAGETPGGPSTAPKGPDDPKTPHTPNQFSSRVLQGLTKAAGKPLTDVSLKTGTELSELLGKSGARLLVKGLPMLGKTLPVISIVVDVASIVTTWTNNDETLENAAKLKSDILQSTAAFRRVVQEYLAALKDLFGDQMLQSSLRKLLRLPRPPPGPPGGPPDDPEKACLMFKMMEQMPDISLVVFAALQGDAHEDPTENNYMTELVPEADVQQLSQMSASAPVIDAVYERHPDVEQPPEQPHDKSIFFGTIAFRALCSWRDISGREVFNVDGSSIDKRVSSWVGFWSWWISARKKVDCLDPDCHIIRPGSHTDDIVGGHLETVDRRDRGWYILPICKNHNAPAGTYDRVPPRGQIAQFMITSSRPKSWAVRIPSLF
ncbi:MAG: hypothetical protein M1837_001154 [Sclerophora amabilis]|nr:MAG: hypothetical protein M1837_001154 [Sclerophora amabilis]